mgnify:CR=1 FL=1
MTLLFVLGGWWVETSQLAGGGVRLVFGRGYSSAAWIGVPLRDGSQSKAGEPAFYARVTKGW